MKTLLLDDDRSFRELTAATVRQAGHDVIEAGAATEALRLLREDQGIGVVVLELLLRDGEITGPEFMALHSLRGNHQGLIVISRDSRGIVLDEIARIARGSDCQLHAVIPHNDVLRTLPRRLTQIAMDGILQGEQLARDGGA